MNIVNPDILVRMYVKTKRNHVHLGIHIPKHHTPILRSLILHIDMWRAPHKPLNRVEALIMMIIDSVNTQPKRRLLVLRGGFQGDVVHRRVDRVAALVPDICRYLDARALDVCAGCGFAFVDELSAVVLLAGVFPVHYVVADILGFVAEIWDIVYAG